MCYRVPSFFDRFSMAGVSPLSECQLEISLNNDDSQFYIGPFLDCH